MVLYPACCRLLLPYPYAERFGTLTNHQPDYLGNIQAREQFGSDLAGDLDILGEMRTILSFCCMVLVALAFLFILDICIRP
jgi:hypothetical protein